MYNTIILLKGKAFLTNREYDKFEKGDTIYGTDSNPEEIKRWSIDKKEKAMKELNKHKCLYDTGSNVNLIEEYALEYCECDEDSEFIQGSDYDLSS